MSSINDGGPAFPAPVEPKTDWTLQDVTSGMSLRDWFAGQALAGAVQHQPCQPAANGMAQRAYELADAMLAVRALRPTPSSPEPREKL